MEQAAGIGQRIKRAREARGESQQGLAAKLGMSRPHIWRIERGDHLPTVTTLAAVSDALDVDLCWLVAGDAARRRWVPEE